MPVGVHGLVFTGEFDARGLERAITGAARTGFDLVEFPVFDPAAWDVETTRALLAEHGLQATVSLGLPEDRNISSDDPAVVAAGEAFLLDVVDVVAVRRRENRAVALDEHCLGAARADIDAEQHVSSPGAGAR